jgi:glycosyltransferase involved in cell wall biosynthesis
MLSIVVPCYRDQGNIRELVQRLTDVLTTLPYEYEIIYVNDCSPDGSAVILNEIASKRPEITVIHHSRNFGKMAVIDTGFRQAVGDAVVYIDGDL